MVAPDDLHKFCRNSNRGVVKAFQRQGERKMKDKQPFHMATCIDPEVFKVMFLFKMRKVADGMNRILRLSDNRYKQNYRFQ